MIIKAILFIVLLVVSVSLLFFNLPIVHYLVPESFNGWVVVSYFDTQCATDSFRNKIIAVSVSKEGVGCTDQEVSSEYIRTKWVVVNDNNEEIGELTEIPWGSEKKGVWGHAVLERNDRGLLQEYFYIGTEVQLKNDWNKMPTK